jgi:hypothetical protein
MAGAAKIPEGKRGPSLTGATLARMNASVGGHDWCVRFWMGDIVMLSAGRILRPEMVCGSGVYGWFYRVRSLRVGTTLRLFKTLMFLMGWKGCCEYGF